MSRNNSEGAQRASTLATSTRGAAEQSDATMKQLNQTVASMADSADEVSKDHQEY